MREVNFSIPSANKASVSITTALYDRRALDCTSTLPLINSLNNLAYLTTSSGRIRDILTVDGGIERLVCILKEGRSKDLMEMWKWNLAFQCIVNIGVRGSEAVRTRVVEADMVPVIATILDNYFHVIDKCRERADSETKRKSSLAPAISSAARGFSRSSARHDALGQHRSERTRRHAPPPIAIPEPDHTPETDEPNGDITPTATAPALSLSSPPERTTFPRQPQPSSHHHHQSHHHHHRSHGQRLQFASPTAGSSRQTPDQPMSAVPLHSNAGASFGLRVVRDIDRLPSMVPTLHAELNSQPQSPATPVALSARPAMPVRVPVGPPSPPAPDAHPWRPRRQSVRRQLSLSGSEDGTAVEDLASSNETEPPRDPVDVQADIVMQDIVDDDGILEPRTDTVTLAVSEVSTNEDETFNITHRSSTDGSAVNPTVTPTQGQTGFAPAPIPPALNPLNATPPSMQQTPAWLPPRQPFDRPAPASILAAMPRDEDVLMSLQLLAYVSKYCNLRTYFQQTHLVPRLKIGKELRLHDPDYQPTNPSSSGPTDEELDEEWDNEFVQKPGEKPYNIFPLIEKFTAKPSSASSSASSSRHANSSAPPASPQQGDMQYWAGVVMRNLCRKDDSRGGIRQCAYWQCGKWEEYTRQFAKCRRCRRTKYCSKECQKGAWGSHRFWCVAAEDSREGEPGSSSEHRHSHRHHHHHHRSHAHQQQR